MNLTKSELDFVRYKLILRFLIIVLVMETIACCGPGRTGGRPRPQKKLRPLVYKQHVPNVPEKTLAGAGPKEGRIWRSDSRFRDLVPNYNADIIFKDEEGTGEDRLMTQRCKERLNTLAVSVMNLWPGVRLRVTESWDSDGIHHPDSLHYEGRAVDITTSDRDTAKLGMLARLAVEAGFDWVYYESRAHIHCSVKSESSQTGRSLGCFTGYTTVSLSSGETKPMSQLQVGDRVLSLNSNGYLEYSEVMIFMHRNPQLKSQFLRITTASGKNITITPSHLILRWQKANRTSLYEAEPIYAMDVKVNETLLISGHSKDKELYTDRIKKIEIVHEIGVYAPLTITGTIVVNDVIASCYAVIYSQRLAHLSFAPMRLYNTLETSFKSFYYVVMKPFAVRSQNSTITSRYIPPSGVHWYCKFLQTMTEFFVPSSWLLE